MLTPDDIKTLRKNLDLRQFEFGQLLGLASTTQKRVVAMYENGTRLPCLQTLRHMRTLNAVSNAILALDMERPAIARMVLEDVFRDTGAALADENDIDELASKMRGR